MVLYYVLVLGGTALPPRTVNIVCSACVVIVHLLNLGLYLYV